MNERAPQFQPDFFEPEPESLQQLQERLSFLNQSLRDAKITALDEVPSIEKEISLVENKISEAESHEENVVTESAEEITEAPYSETKVSELLDSKTKGDNNIKDLREFLR